ncbi:Uncharacterised protein [Clostridioides difficile]|nr:hypothetical protein [Clostridioides difficile]UWD40699.1 hypothetical protein NYF05_15290 [Clostridioides difficile]UWD44485.1 hypothetical protein NYU56_15050 [Clostridioides difficile]VFF94735.1 Uncharacterised protein [Clostridioides difficile]VIG11078.1 Uncharacterised protein [Clostridioides difficile]
MTENEKELLKIMKVSDLINNIDRADSDRYKKINEIKERINYYD